ncbi:MAG: vWA domain-containing protein [Opitutaceae bacterium]
MKRPFIPICCAFLCFSVPAFAEAPVAVEQSSESARSEVEVRAILDGTIIPEFAVSSMPLSEVLELLSELLGLNIVPLYSKEHVDPKVSLSLRNLSAAKVLQFVCQQVNFGWSIGNGVIFVAPAGGPEGGSSGGLETEFFPVSRASVIRLTGFQDHGGSASGPVDPFAPPSSAGFSAQMPAPNPVLDGGAVSGEDFNTEEYGKLVENPFRSPEVEALSTFSIDVDTASFANVRRFLNDGSLPPSDAVRIEELVNYFEYDYAAPEESADAVEGSSSIKELVEQPFAVHTELGDAFWRPGHQLLKIGLKGYELDWDKRPQTNLVFLLDVSGSMGSAKKLPLVKDALELLVRKLDGRDRVAIVVYAGASGLVLPSTTANNTETILHAMGNLKAGGSTNGGEGIELAYKVAKDHFIEEGVNRVILCTDGDFNVGVGDTGALTRVIEEKAKSGVYLTICGFGRGNLNDELMESLSNSGNGNYAYIDSQSEARRAFSQGAAGSVLTIAQDVKIQIEFNPAKVKAYRLIGYENRILNAEDFNDDTKDAGELGSGHTVTALYEIAPHDSDLSLSTVDPLKYQSRSVATDENSELATVKLRYKWPREDSSNLLSQVVEDEVETFASCSEDFRFASAVAAWGMILRESEFQADASLSKVLKIAEGALGNDSGGLRSGFLELIERTDSLSPATSKKSD